MRRLLDWLNGLLFEHAYYDLDWSQGNNDLSKEQE